jgi:hypothetical protein
MKHELYGKKAFDIMLGDLNNCRTPTHSLYQKLSNEYSSALNYVESLLEVVEGYKDRHASDQNRIADLEKRLDEYETPVLSYEEAKAQAKKQCEAFIEEGKQFEYIDTGKMIVVSEKQLQPINIERYEFDYTGVREPQPGDLVIAPMKSIDRSGFCSGVVVGVEDLIVRLNNAYMSHIVKENIKPITHKVDENGNIVPVRSRK